MRLSSLVWLEDIVSADAEETYTCPHCGFESYNLNDLANRYCRPCLHFCNDVDEALRLSGFTGSLGVKEDVKDRQDRPVLQSRRPKRRLSAFLRRWLPL